MINLQKYISYGERTLKSKVKSSLFYDFKLLKKKENKEDKNKILSFILKIQHNFPESTLVGIYSIGAYLVKSINQSSIIYYPRLRKLSKHLIKCIGFKEEYILVDDVGTSFDTIKETIRFIDFLPMIVIVIINRIDINNGIYEIEVEPYGSVKILELRKEFSSKFKVV